MIMRLHRLCFTVAASIGTTALATLLTLHPYPPPLWLRSLTALCAIGTILACRWYCRPAEPDLSHGSARFARPDEAAEFAQAAHLPLPPGGMLLAQAGPGKVFALGRNWTARHTLILGGSGAGKSYSLFLPNAVAAAAMDCSVFFLDVKSELWRFSSGYHRTAWRFAPEEPARSTHGMNWIPLCAKARSAELIARTLVGVGRGEGGEDAVWKDVEAAYLTALFGHTATLSHPTPLTAYKLLTGVPQAELIRRFQDSPSPVAREQAVILSEMSDRMRGSVVPILAARLQFLRHPAVARFTSAELAPPPFALLREKPTAVYYCLREQSVAALRPLTALFFNVLLDTLAGGDDSGDSVCAPLPVTLYLDEFPTVAGSLPDFLTTLALARGRGIAFCLGVQSVAQLEVAYGKAGAQVVVDNAATKITLASLDADSAAYVARVLGDGTVSGRSRSTSGRRFAPVAASRTEGETSHRRPLLSPDEVRRLGDDQLIVVIGNRHPLLATRLRFTGQPNAAHPGGLPRARSCPPSASPPSASPVEPASRTRRYIEDPPEFPPRTECRYRRHRRYRRE